MKYTDLMIDLETLGNEGQFLVTQVALVPFSLEEELDPEVLSINNLIVNFNPKELIKKGFEINTGTINWWIENNIDTFIESIKGKTGLNEGCHLIKKFLEKDMYSGIERYWASATLDYQGLSNLFKSQDMINPFVYNKRNCCRTIRTLHQQLFDSKYQNTNNHNPVEDCIQQIKLLRQQWSDIQNLKKNEDTI